MSDENREKGTQINSDSLPFLLGQISGELRGISKLIRDSNDSTNRRIDDLSKKMDVQTSAINTRIDDHKNEIDERFDSHDRRISDLENRRGRSRAESAGISTAIPVAIEIIKRMFS